MVSTTAAVTVTPTEIGGFATKGRRPTPSAPRWWTRYRKTARTSTVTFRRGTSPAPPSPGWTILPHGGACVCVFVTPLGQHFFFEALIGMVPGYRTRNARHHPVTRPFQYLTIACVLTRTRTDFQRASASKPTRKRRVSPPRECTYLYESSPFPRHTNAQRALAIPKRSRGQPCSTA